jgi:hypothetical protein
MRFKVELRKEVVQYLRRECHDAERREFYQRLEAFRSDPLTDTEPTVDVRLSRYVLRFFRFGRHLAVFQWDAARELIVVRECRRPRVGRPPGRDATDAQD